MESYDLADLENKDIALTADGTRPKPHDEEVSDGPEVIENNSNKVLGVVQSEDGDAFVRRMMKERGITRNPENESSMEKVVDQVSEKDNKGAR